MRARTRKVQTNKTNYMSDEAFADLKGVGGLPVLVPVVGQAKAVVEDDDVHGALARGLRAPDEPARQIQILLEVLRAPICRRSQARASACLSSVCWRAPSPRSAHECPRGKATAFIRGVTRTLLPEVTTRVHHHEAALCDFAAFRARAKHFRDCELCCDCRKPPFRVAGVARHKSCKKMFVPR